MTQAQTNNLCDNALAALTITLEDCGPEAPMNLFKAQVSAFLVFVANKTEDPELAVLSALTIVNKLSECFLKAVSK